MSWEALVLPTTVVDQLKAVPGLLSSRFWTKSPGDSESGAEARRGMLVLFAGADGTGKTLAAQALGHELRLPVLEADIAAFYSRGRSEATQLIARLFATAERLGAVLVLDHSDGVLLSARPAARPGVAGLTANDVRDLLRRCEAYPGLVVFPSTVKHDIDDATLHRFDRVIDFPFPEAAARAEIWRRSLGPRAALADSDIELLAATFQLPGKAIAACCAAARAQAGGRAVGLEHVATALEGEYSQRLASATTRLALAGLRKRVADHAPTAPEGPPPTRVDPPRGGETPRRLEAVPPRPAAPAAGEQTRTPERLSPPGPAPVPFGRAPESVAATPSLPVAGPSPPVAKATEPVARAAQPREYRVIKTELPPPSTAAVVAEPPPVEPPPEPEAPPAPVHRRRTRGRRRSHATRRLLAAIAMLGAIVAAVLGFVVSHPGSTPALPALVLDRSGTAGPAHFVYPSDWRESAAPTVAGLPLTDGVALASNAAPRGRVIIGLVKSSSSSPLPESFVAATLPGASTPQLVVLGGNHFFRVLDPGLAAGRQSQSVYALPTTGGAIVALCHTASQAFAASCERILATLRAPAPGATTPAPDAIYASKLSTILASLNSARTSDARELAGARDPATQARAASALASAHTSAATAVSALSAGTASRANVALATALRRTADAYHALSQAAASNNAGAYRAAQSAVARGNAGITSALAALDTLGYRVE